MDDIKPRGRGQQTRQQSSVPPWRSTASQPSKPKQEYVPPSPSKRYIPPPRTSKKSKKRRRRIILWFMVFLLASGGAGYWFVLKPRLNAKPPAPTAANEQPAPKQSSEPVPISGNFRIVASGDIITHDSVTQNARTPEGSYNFAPMLDEIKPFLINSQARICHNTVPAAGGGLSGYPSFNAPSELISSLASGGCNVLSLASDHINDKGQPAIDATLASVDAQKDIVISSGANRSIDEKAKERFFNVGDGQVKFAYFSYTTRSSQPPATNFGVNMYDKNTALADIKKARQTADFIMVSMCWGKEDSGDIQPDQDTIAQELAEAGADMVFGHCTHIVQPAKRLKSADGARETIIYYSLGNTLNSQLPVETLVGGLAVVDIDLATKKVTAAGFLPTYMHYEWTAAQKAAKETNARKNLKLYPLDKAEAPLAASQNGTTAATQTARVTEILNRFTPIKMLKSTDTL